MYIKKQEWVGCSFHYIHTESRSNLKITKLYRCTCHGKAAQTSIAFHIAPIEGRCPQWSAAQDYPRLFLWSQPSSGKHLSLHDYLQHVENSSVLWFKEFLFTVNCLLFNRHFFFTMKCGHWLRAFHNILFTGCNQIERRVEMVLGTTEP